MKKILVALAALVIVACHTKSPYVFDIPKILAMDGRKIPDMLGTPNKATLPQEDTQAENGGEAIYQYVKGKYVMKIFYNYQTGAINEIQLAKIIPIKETANTDVNKEKAELPLVFNLKNIYITNFKTDTVDVIQEPNAPILVLTNVHLTKPSSDADSTTIPMQPAPKQ